MHKFTHITVAYFCSIITTYKSLANNSFDSTLAIYAKEITASKSIDRGSESEQIEQTTVLIYFSNGRDKFYSFTPQIVLRDPVSGEIVKTFERTVDTNGNPEPQTGIPLGNYDVTISGAHNIFLKNVMIEPNKKNKIVITVEDVELSFEYVNNTSRTISEFNATVTLRDPANRRTIIQKCTEKLRYEPGNYQVEINTFPKDVRNVDLDNGEKVIRIWQPGFVIVWPTKGVDSVTFYENPGKNHTAIETFSMADPALRHLQIQPGRYEARFHKTDKSTEYAEKIVHFRIKPTKETVVKVN